MNNKKKIFKFHLFSIIFCLVFGTLLHFTFQWSGENVIIASFSAVNESIWEHLKLLFFPMLFTTIIGYFFIAKDNPSYLCARVKGIVTAILFVTVFFYTYTGIIGVSYTFLDIGSFFVGILLGEYISYRQMILSSSCHKILAFSVVSILLVSFIYFTYFPPRIPYFEDSITGSYGFQK